MAHAGAGADPRAGYHVAPGARVAGQPARRDVEALRGHGQGQGDARTDPDPEIPAEACAESVREHHRPDVADAYFRQHHRLDGPEHTDAGAVAAAGAAGAGHVPCQRHSADPVDAGGGRDADIRSAAQLDRPANPAAGLGGRVASRAGQGHLATEVLAVPQPVLSPGALFRKRFLRHRLAVVSAVVVALFYLVVAFADFLAYSDPAASSSQRALVPPQPIHFFDEGRFAPHVHGLTRSRNPQTYGLEYVADEAQTIPVVFLARGYEYRLLGLIPTDRHLIGTEGAPTETSLFLLGADEQGRDLFSRIALAIRTSLLIGLAAVAVSISVGIVCGSLSVFYGGL
ncbi:MAG: hypothetical protein F4181_13795, partial [Proteobacteria bacterium]|nr:hypothetical protein [Pseudomonadota bacterium]